LPRRPNSLTLQPYRRMQSPFVSVIIPAYREEEYIANTIRDVITSLRENRFQFEVLVVLDSVPGDRTGLIIHALCERFPELRLIERSGKRGIGDSVSTGIKARKGSVFVLVMGDHSESADDLVRLVNTVTQGYDIAFGERFKHGKPHGYPLLKYIANRCCNYLIRLLFRVPSLDTTNAFKAYNAQVLDQLDLSSKGFEIFVEMPLKVFLRVPEVKIVNIPVQHFVGKKREAKLSLLKEGPNYIRMILSLFVHGKVKKASQNL